MSENLTRDYMGDSVYVEMENGMVKLFLDNGLGPSDTIFLEPTVAEALVRYFKRLKVIE